MRSTKRAALALGFLSVLSPLLWSQISLSLSPVQAEMALAPGKTGVLHLAVANGSASPVRIEASVEEWAPGIRNADVFPAAAAAKLSGKRWLRIELSLFPMAVGEAVQIPVTVTVPAVAEPGQYTAAISFRSVAEAGSEDPSGGLSLQGKLTALIIVTVGKPRDEGSVADLSLERKDGRAILVLRRRNAGRFILPTEGEIIVRDARGKKMYAADFTSDPVPPLSDRVFRIALETDLPSGRYQAECVLRLLSGKKTTVKKPVGID